MHRFMKTGILIFCASLAAFAAAGCDDDGIDGSGVAAMKEYNFTGFSSIVAESGFRVRCTLDSLYAVTVTTDDNLQDMVDVFLDGTALNLKVKPGNDVSFNILRADVHMPQLSALVLSAGANCEIGEGFSSNAPFAAVLSAGAHAEGSLESGPVSCVLSAGSVLTLSGSGSTGAVVASAGSTADLRTYALGDVSVTADGGSVVYVNVTGRLNVSASGGSRVYYRGDVQLGEVSITGGSTLQSIP